jgi:hypothetical protein
MSDPGPLHRAGGGGGLICDLAAFNAPSVISKNWARTHTQRGVGVGGGTKIWKHQFKAEINS